MSQFSPFYQVKTTMFLLVITKLKRETQIVLIILFNSPLGFGLGLVNLCRLNYVNQCILLDYSIFQPNSNTIWSSRRPFQELEDFLFDFDYFYLLVQYWHNLDISYNICTPTRSTLFFFRKYRYLDIYETQSILLSFPLTVDSDFTQILTKMKPKQCWRRRNA